MRIRKEIINATVEQWKKIDNMASGRFINISPKEFYEKIGIVGCFTSIANTQEKKFFEQLYKQKRGCDETKLYCSALREFAAK